MISLCRRPFFIPQVIEKKMEVDQHIAVTISEIDRTLRSLGIQDEYASTLSQSPIISSPPAFTSAMVARTNSAAQTSSSFRVNSGVQKNCSTSSQSMQHSPQQRAASCQTEKGTSTPEYLVELATSVGCTYAILEEKFQAFESYAGKIEALFVKLARVKGITRSSAKMLYLLQNRWSIGVMEREEMLARSAALSCESDARAQLTSLRCGELVRLVATFREEKVLSKLSGGPKRVVQTSVMADVQAQKEIPDSSLSDFNELLDECWRVLDE